MATATKRRKEAKNTFRLPSGEGIRRELAGWFRLQRRAMMRWLETGEVQTKDLWDRIAHLPTWDHFDLGALPMSERMAPRLESIYDAAGQRFTTQIGLDPDEWDVTNPRVQDAIQEAALAFCDETNQTTTLSIEDAAAAVRKALSEGLFDRGESVRQLTKRVKGIFTDAETWRARRIATSEASRAVHRAQEIQAEESEVVSGWEWLISANSCEICKTIARRAPTVKLGQPFAIIGTHKDYAQIKFPPAHPGCRCTTAPITIYQDQPEWAATLDQPEPEDEDYEEGLPESTITYHKPVAKPPRLPKRKPKPPKEPWLDADNIEESIDQFWEHNAKNPNSTTTIRNEGIAKIIQKFSFPIGSKKIHGMATEEVFHSFFSRDINWNYTIEPDGALKHDSAIVQQVIEWQLNKDKWDALPKRLRRQTTDVYMTKQKNSHDAMWKQKYKDFTESAHTGGDGNVVCYQGLSVRLGSFAHESGHNLAKHVYGDTSPHMRPTSDFNAAIASGEKPVSDYGKNSSAEDFAEASRLYVEMPLTMKVLAPKRFAVIDRLMKDPNYGG